MSEIQQIKTFFDSHELPLCGEWLQCCVEWCKSDCLPPNYTQKDLQLKVYEQWLLLDLREVQVTSLPRGLSTQKKYTLTGTYCLQMMQVVDISKPKLWQIQRIRNTVGKNTEPENDFGKRVLQLTFTDGVQEIEAFEYKPIPLLNINLVPGIKIKLMGPIMVRNGRLMLENHHVKILGGEVEEIRMLNAAENVLARSLGLEENPNPFVIDESILTANMDIINASTYQGTQTSINLGLPAIQNSNNNKKGQEFSTNYNNKVDNNRNRTNNFEIENNFKNLKKNSEENFEIDEELLREFQNDDFEEEVSGVCYTKNKPVTNNTNITLKRTVDKVKSSSPDMFDNMEVDDDLLNEHWNQLDKIEDNEFKTEDSNVDKQNTHSKTEFNSSIQIEGSNDFFNNSDLDAHLDKLDAETTNKTVEHKVPEASSSMADPLTNNTVVPPKSNVFSIEKLKKLQPNIGKGKFKITAVFKDVVEKMGIDEETKQYKLVICVKDDKDELLLNVHSELVANWMELSAESLINVKQLIFEKNLEALETFKKTLTKLREAVMNLNGVIEVEITRGQKYPVLVSIIS